MLIATLILAAAQTQTVSFTHPVAPCRTIIPKLGEALGTPMRVEGDVQWEVLYIKVANASLIDLKANIAKAAQGKWDVASDGVQVLRRDTTFADRFVEKQRRVLATELNNYIKFSQTGIRTMPAGSVVEQEVKTNQAQVSREVSSDKEEVLPTDKVLGQIVQTIGVKTLSSLSPGQRMVFSTHPTQMQKPVRFDASWVAMLSKEHNQQFSEVQEDPTDETVSELLANYPPEIQKMMKQMMELEKPKRMGTNASKVNVVFEMSKWSDSSIEASIHIYDDKGAENGNFSRSLGGMFDEYYDNGEDYDDEGNVKPDPSPKISMSPESKKLLSLINGEARASSMGDQPSSLFTEFKEKMKDPERSDPWLTITDEVMQGWSKIETANMVVNISNAYMRYVSEYSVNSLRRMFQVKEPVGPWIVYTPSLPSAPINRSTLKQAIEKVEAGDLRLDDRAWFAVNFDEYYYSPTYSLYQMVFKFPYTSFDQSLKIYGMLSDSQKLAAKNGIKIPFATMGKDLKTLVYQLAFGSEHVMQNGHEPMDEMAYFSGDPEQYFKKEMEKRLNRLDYLEEPTEALPGGLPNDGYLELSISEGPGFIPADKNADFAYFMSQSFNLEQLAGMVAMGELMKSEYPMPMPTEYKEVTRSEWKLELKATPKYGFSGRLYDNVPKQGAKVKKVEELGPDFDKLVAAQKDKMKKWMPFTMGMGSRGRGQNVPPE